MTFFPPLLALMATTASTKSREFRFVPYGKPFDSHNDHNSRKTVSCDGRIPGGVSLELTHWTDNTTPDELYADTSTEMALNFCKQYQHKHEFDDALILNNHFDSDGVLSVWACLHPIEALQYSTLLTQGAEAGDFGEWNSDNGVKLDCAIEAFLGSGDEEEAYHRVLEELPNLLQDLSKTGGESYQALWMNGFDTALQDYETIKDGATTLTRGPGRMVIVKEPRFLSPFALHRGLNDGGLIPGTTRILHCLANNNDGTYRYQYEMPGYGWVKRLKDRPVIPTVDASQLVKQLPYSDCWSQSGSLSGICHTTRPIKTSPNDLATLLHELDDGCQE